MLLSWRRIDRFLVGDWFLVFLCLLMYARNTLDKSVMEAVITLPGVEGGGRILL